MKNVFIDVSKLKIKEELLQRHGYKIVRPWTSSVVWCGRRTPWKNLLFREMWGGGAVQATDQLDGKQRKNRRLLVSGWPRIETIIGQQSRKQQQWSSRPCRSRRSFGDNYWRRRGIRIATWDSKILDSFRTCIIIIYEYRVIPGGPSLWHSLRTWNNIDANSYAIKNIYERNILYVSVHNWQSFSPHSALFLCVYLM